MRTRALVLAGVIFSLVFGVAVSSSFAEDKGVEAKKGYRYAVLVSRETYADADWKKVADALIKKHDGKLFQYPKDDMLLVIEEVGKYMPDYMAFVARPEEAPRAFVNRVHRFARALDEDPYTDAIWGIVTGYTPENALKVAEYNKPLTIKRALGTFGGWLGRLEEGKCFADTKDQEYSIKNAETKGKLVMKNDGPIDAAKLFVDEINKDDYDMVWTSSHATEKIFAGFRHNKPTGKIVPKKGKLVAIDLDGNEYPITTTNPKIYYPAGNCLIGHIPDKECMALAWINSGAYQMFGYLVPTGYGYQGWGLASFFFEQNDRFTFAESYFLNTQTMFFDMRNKTPGVMLGPRGLDRYKDNTVFYGDPAWEVRVVNTNPPQHRLYETKLEIKNVKDNQCEVTFTIEFNSDVKIGNRTGGGNRPAAVIFPARFANIKNIKNDFELPANKVLVMDNFMMVDFWGEDEDEGPYDVKKGHKIIVTFTADKIR